METASVAADPADGIALHIAQVSRLHRPEVPAWIEAQDMTFGQLRLLFRLAHQGPASMSRVAAWLGVSTATATGIVERVERHGLVERRHREDDRRVVECRVTDQGERLVAEVDGIREEAIRQIVAVLDGPELAELDRILQLIIKRSVERQA